MTGLDATAYWQSYYGDDFVFGLGTEHIIALLRELPSVDTWIDVGSGSESLLWGCAIDAKYLMAVDVDSDRLALLRAYATAAEPRGAYRTVLELSGRQVSDWSRVRTRLRGTQMANCLSGAAPVPDRAQLVTQFGLLGLCPDEETFVRCFAALAQLVVPGGWLAGANWMAARSTGRVVLTEELYRTAFQACGVDIVRLIKIDSADPDYPYLWSYLARQPGSPEGRR